MQKPYIHHLDAEMNRMLTAMKLYLPTFAIVFLIIPALLINLCCATNSNRHAQPDSPKPSLELIRPGEDGTSFVHAESGLSLSGIFAFRYLIFFLAFP